MILEPSNYIGAEIFKEYIRQLRTKAGVAMNSQYLMYVMAKSPESDQIEMIGEE